MNNLNNNYSVEFLKCCISEINTVNASPCNNNIMRGGLLLIKLKNRDITAGKLKLILSYMDRKKENKFSDEYLLELP